MELHYKCTMWCKLIFSDETDKKDLIEKLNDGYLPLELGFDNIVKGVENTEWDVIYATESYLTPKENKGQSTIELFEDITKPPIWNNSKKNEF